MGQNPRMARGNGTPRGRRVENFPNRPSNTTDMECGKDLAEGEKVLAIKEITKVKTNKSIVERMNRFVMTEIGESVTIFRKILQRGNLGLIAVV